MGPRYAAPVLLRIEAPVAKTRAVQTARLHRGLRGNKYWSRQSQKRKRAKENSASRKFAYSWTSPAQIINRERSDHKDRHSHKDRYQNHDVFKLWQMIFGRLKLQLRLLLHHLGRKLLDRIGPNFQGSFPRGGDLQKFSISPIGPLLLEKLTFFRRREKV